MRVCGPRIFAGCSKTHEGLAAGSISGGSVATFTEPSSAARCFSDSLTFISSADHRISRVRQPLRMRARGLDARISRRLHSWQLPDMRRHALLAEESYAARTETCVSALVMRAKLVKRVSKGESVPIIAGDIANGGRGGLRPAGPFRYIDGASSLQGLALLQRPDHPAFRGFS